MEKRKLARQMRKRQYAEFGRKVIDALDDDEIIDCSITCPRCGEKQVDGPHRALAIAKATDVDSFLDECNRLARGHADSPLRTPGQHEWFLAENWYDLAALAWHGYQEAGRGFLDVRVDEVCALKQGVVQAKKLLFFVPASKGIPDPDLERMVREYDPETSIVCHFWWTEVGRRCSQRYQVRAVGWMTAPREAIYPGDMGQVRVRTEERAMVHGSAEFAGPAEKPEPEPKLVALMWQIGDMNYGETLAECLRREGTPGSALARAADLLAATAEAFRKMAAGVAGKDVQIRADTDNIEFTGPESVIQPLIDQHLMARRADPDTEARFRRFQEQVAEERRLERLDGE